MTVEQRVPAAQRGTTRIADRVVAKLARQAAREALRAPRDDPPAPHGRPGGPQATAVVRRPPGADGTGGLASVRVSVELAYPSDIGAQCGAVRHHVTRRVGELAGMELQEVAVAVERLRSSELDGAASGKVL
ncbi:Asp23/Gls24 family envelope stress response protein [Streptomyces sp. 3MP-14]|uniref:Asp23/Gls24 family envelope stress response protein n=1 Tax=Streptomyces mimosae TaxID=2586635 RepID=A0A5N5ZLW8_9ACTN|nr:MULTISPECIES: Asp23/Gls24 family envelope stress response protein [Streptomyces]KAB8157491.1 Asp23/Gls24 family envelope stress response protein [Streptomyces mimosae]KAB8172480.1 Asp23/Gls24 family envelope stress response protein [Streptomyces sp. 3MP-14]